MKIKKIKPTSPGIRHSVSIINDNLYKGKPKRDLVFNIKKKSGRNNKGRITIRGRGGGNKKMFRLIDFFRNKENILAKIKRIEYDPNRSSNIALCSYEDGCYKYIISPKDIKIGETIISGKNVPVKTGNSMLIKNIPLGIKVHCIEINPGSGAQLSRSAGSFCLLLSRDKKYTQVQLKSGCIRLIHKDCKATVGEVGNIFHNLKKLGKAGIKRKMGFRPKVRGVAMNPIDHPHGGGEGKTGEARIPVSPWGLPTKGYKTRKNKRTNKMIIRRNKK